jgi:hypothetical protein
MDCLFSFPSGGWSRMTRGSQVLYPWVEAAYEKEIKLLSETLE